MENRINGDSEPSSFDYETESDFDHESDNDAGNE